MDIRLAGQMDGIEAAREIAARHDVPIIFVTGYSTPEIAQRCQALDPAGYLLKPVAPPQVDEAIRVALVQAARS